jgi:lipid-A-disaccharide synthase-like uncharacterized protein
MLEMIGYLGLLFVAICWLPQTVETVREGKCGANTYFLFLSALGSVCLTVYAVSRSDVVFSILNTLTAIGAFINLFYKFFPRTSA